MNASCDCPVGRKRRAVKDGAGWIVPDALLILLPKCPLCLAATISLICGIGLSTDAATVVQKTVMVLCTIAISTFAGRQIRPFVRRPAAQRDSIF